MTQYSTGPADAGGGVRFAVGDKVVYRSQGAGTIIGQVEREIGGKTGQFLEIELMKGGMRVLVPLGQGERVGLRRITEADRVPELLELLRGPDMDLPSGWTPRHRKEQNLLAEGDVFRLATLVGTLHRRDIERALSVTERRILDDARHVVATEIAMATGVGLDNANERIAAILEE